MVAKWLSRYWFLATTIGALSVAFALRHIAIASNLALLVSALTGLVLALSWTINTIRNRELGSDSLAIIAIVAAISIAEYWAAAIVSLMLATGRALEDWAAQKSQRELKSLLERAPNTAHLLQRDNAVRDVALADVLVGDRIRVLNGEVVPLDGVLQTEGEFDESALTGEPMPVRRLVGDAISSGVVNSSASIELEVTSPVEQSTYANLIRLVQATSATSSKTVRLANRWALWFVPFTLLFALATLWLSGDVRASVAVLIAATPCPLILAMPVAIISGMSRSAARGAIIKGGETLELLAKVNTVMLDKTGTLTHGGPELNGMAVKSDWIASEVLQLAASLERHSPHIVAKAIVSAAEKQQLKLLSAERVLESHGHGITGMIGERQVTVGQPPEQLPDWAQLESELQASVLVNGELIAVLGFDDPLRDEAIDTIENLRKLGVSRIILVSGDKRANAERVAAAISADQFYAECTPAQKLDLVEQEKDRATVALVGDGINDAPGLAAASVGVAMGARGATAASEAADVVIVEDSLKHLASAIDIAQGAYRKARQAGAAGMALAICSMVAASFAALNPTQAALVQELIDAAAILWALTRPRLRLK